MHTVELFEDKVQPYLREFARQQVTVRDICRRMEYIGQSSDPVEVRFQKTHDLLQKGYRLLESFRSAGIRFVQELHSSNQAMFSGNQMEKNADLCEKLRGQLVAVFHSWDGLIHLMNEDPRVRQQKDLMAGKIEPHRAEKIRIGMAAVCREAGTFTLDLAAQALDFKVMSFGMVTIMGILKRDAIREGIADIFEEILEDLHDAELLTQAQSHHEELIPWEGNLSRQNASYSVVLVRSAQEGLGDLPSGSRSAVQDIVGDLANHPHTKKESESLTGYEARKILLGNYRVVFTLSNVKRLIVVHLIRSQGETYRRLADILR